MSVSFHMDSHEVDGYLAQITEEKRATAIRTSTMAGAKAAVPILRSHTPVGRTHHLWDSVQAKSMRKRYGIGAVVAPMTRKARLTKSGKVRAGTGTEAQHRALVSFGTKRHVIPGGRGGFLTVGDRYLRAVQHPGAKANPFIDKAASSMEAAAFGAFEDRMVRYIVDGRWQPEPEATR